MNLAIKDQGPKRDLFTPPPLDPVVLVGVAEKTRTRVLNEELCEEIRNLLPARLQLYDSWHLAYSLEQHGASLHTLYGNLRLNGNNNKRSGYVICIRDQSGNSFGAYTNEPFHPTDLKRYYGNGECFLWKTTKLPNGDTRFQAFPYTGINDFVIFCTSRFLSLGGGDGHYGLWIDDDLNVGISDRSLTFGNEPLSSVGSKFHIIGLEVWRVY
jgi:TLD